MDDIDFISTLCYLEQNGCYLMLHRTAKDDDVNAGKWIGVGGKLKKGETPEECLVREVYEETGIELRSARYRGLITFIYESKDPEYIFTYTSDDFNANTASLSTCDEGELRWVEKTRLKDLELWEGDYLLIDLLLSDREEPFSLKLVYDSQDRLVQARGSAWAGEG